MNKIRFQLKKQASSRRFARRTSAVPGKTSQCPCCGGLTLETGGTYEICPVCGWEDDPLQSKDPDFEGGANALSLNQARAQWRKKH